MGLSIHSTTLMGFRTHRTHTYGAQQPQDPHLWGSAPPAPWGGHHPIGRLAALPHRGSLPHGGDGGLHPTPPLPAPQRSPPHGPPPSPPHRMRPQRTPNRPTERDPKGPPTAPPTPQNATTSVGGVASMYGRGLWFCGRGPNRGAGFPMGVASRGGRGLPEWAWPQRRHGSKGGVASIAPRFCQRGALPHKCPQVGLCPITAPMWGSPP